MILNSQTLPAVTGGKIISWSTEMEKSSSHFSFWPGAFDSTLGLIQSFPWFQQGWDQVSRVISCIVPPSIPSQLSAPLYASVTQGAGGVGEGKENKLLSKVENRTV